MAVTPLDEHADAVAIIGMAARLPGAPDVESFWLNLREGVESISRHTRQESLDRGVRPEFLDNPNYVNASAMLPEADGFDARFFNLSSREAAVMDPQHRVFLECAYHALEDAAYDSHRYPGAIGVYAGCTMNTYLLYNVMTQSDNVVATVGDLTTMVSSDKDFLSTRVSHKLDLRGPSLTVQTACSSSLVAVHLAARALLDDECDMALAGGASVRMPLGAGYLSNPGGTSSPDGHCRAFDIEASGSVVGSGVGAVVLKRLSAALRDGDQIHAVIRGSAINNDGSTKASFTAPSVDGQSRAVASALRRAGVSARDVSLVEAHGTGTPLGDPIEVAALTRAFREWTGDREYCWLGSAKPNVGHLDAAAGVTGLIKTVLSLKHRRVPPVVNYRSPNPKLELDRTPFRITAELIDLDDDGPLIATVNSLAMGGTNAHIVLQEAPVREGSGATRIRRHAVPLSARTPTALETMSRTLGQWLREHPSADLADVAYTLSVGRPQLEHRQVVFAKDLDDLSFALTATGSQRRLSGKAASTPRVAFVFPGQGSQELRMGQLLRARDAVFAGNLDMVLDLFRDDAELDLRSYLYPSEPDDAADQARLAETEVTQPALFAVEWALGQTLIDYGVRPYAMLGHSIGELVAATLAGVLTLRAAVAVVARRGQALQEAPEGAMLYVNLPVEEVSERIADTAVEVAAVNAPSLVVVAGPAEAVREFADRLRADGISCGLLDVTRAFHSSTVESAAKTFHDYLTEQELVANHIPVVSNVTGDYVTAEQVTAPRYWAEQMRRPVLFAGGLRTLGDDGVGIMLELGPGQSLRSLIRAAVPDAIHIPTLIDARGKEPADLAEVFAALWLHGAAVDPAAVYLGENRNRLPLPGYPFERVKHWMEPQHQNPAQVPAAVTVTANATAAAQPAADLAGLTPTQRYLVRLWHSLLDVDRIGSNDNFFSLDGTSLLAMQMITQIRQAGGDSVELTAVFEHPTVAGLAGYLERSGFLPPSEDEGIPAHEVTAAPRPEPSAGTNADLDAVLAAVAGLSDDEVQSRLSDLREGS